MARTRTPHHMMPNPSTAITLAAAWAALPCAILPIITEPCYGVEIGSRICAEGFIMDKFCIERGTLLDHRSVRSLRNPEQHTLHCLVDIDRCVSSGYEVLFEPNPIDISSEGKTNNNEEALYRRAWTIDDAGNSKLLSLARRTGARDHCTTCLDELGVSQEIGFRATIFGTVQDMGNSHTPATVTNVTVNSTTVGCDAFLRENNLTVADIMPPVLVGESETFLDDARTHGALMLAGWGLFLPSGAIIAKFGKHSPNAIWYKAHRMIQLVGAIFATVGFAFANTKFDAYSQKGFDAYIHACLGTTVMAIAFFQPINAFLRPQHQMEGEEKTCTQFVWRVLHIGLGWIGCLLAVVTIAYGTTLIPNNRGDQLKFQLGYGLGCGPFLVLLTVFLLLSKKKISNNTAQVDDTLPSSTAPLISSES